MAAGGDGRKQGGVDGAPLGVRDIVVQPVLEHAQRLGRAAEVPDRREEVQGGAQYARTWVSRGEKGANDPKIQTFFWNGLFWNGGPKTVPLRLVCTVAYQRRRDQSTEAERRSEARGRLGAKAAWCTLVALDEGCRCSDVTRPKCASCCSQRFEFSIFKGGVGILSSIDLGAGASAEAGCLSVIERFQTF